MTTFQSCARPRLLPPFQRGARRSARREEHNRASQPILDKLGNNPDYYENRAESRIW